MDWIIIITCMKCTKKSNATTTTPYKISTATTQLAGKKENLFILPGDSHFHRESFEMEKESESLVRLVSAKLPT
jgi:hypothetical protein